MDTKQIVMLALQISIITMVFGFGLKASFGDLLYVVRRPGLLVRSLLAMFVIMPIVTVVLVRAFDFIRAIEIALVALSISPVPPLLPKREGKAGGLMSYALGLMATFGALSIILVPLVLELLQRVFGLSVGVSPGSIASVVLVMILAPLVAGAVIRALAPGAAHRLAGPATQLATIILVLGALPLLVATLPAAWGLIGDGTIVAIVVFVATGLVVGHLLGGPEPDHASVLALSTACRHPAIAFGVASSNFPEERFGGAIILYMIVSALVATPYVMWRKKHTMAVERAR